MNSRYFLCMCGHWQYDHEDETPEEKCENCDCLAFQFNAVGHRVLDPNTARLGGLPPRVGDKVEVRTPGKGFHTTNVIRIDDFGNYWCATWWENIWGYSTYHEPQNVIKL